MRKTVLKHFAEMQPKQAPEDVEASRAADAWAIKWHNFMRSIEMQIRRESKKKNAIAPTAATTKSSPVYLHEALYSYRRFG
jgi:hypothetical protein